MNPYLSKYLFYYPAIIARRQWLVPYLRELNQSQWSDRSCIEEIQQKKLVKLLKNAAENVPYYKRILNEHGIVSIKSLRELRDIPVLTKELLKENYEQLETTGSVKAYKKTTGGSTGNAVTIFQSTDAIAAADAAYWRGFGWAGVGIGFRQGRFWGIPDSGKMKLEAKLKDFILNRKRFSAFSFDKESLSNYYKELNKFKPQYLYGYVSFLEAFALYLQENNLSLKFKLNCVITTSEVLTETHRKLFSQVFKCRVYNEYGCGEVGTIAHECEEGQLHISAENMIVEIVKDGVPVADGNPGDIVVTDLNNRAMPLIRYNLKDNGILSPEKCSCGRSLLVLKSVIGRSYDIIINKEGKAFHGEYFMYIFEELQNLKIGFSAFQVIQESYEKFNIKVVMKSDKNRQILENYIIKRVKDSYGEYADIDFEYVSSIHREKSGKIRLIKSMVNMAA